MGSRQRRVVRRAPVHRAALLALGAGMLIAASACAPKNEQRPVSARFVDGRVEVTISYDHSSATLQATFSPPPGFHLYSKDLARHELGFPTTLTVEGGLRTTGPLESDAEAIAFHLPQGAGTAFVYPDGPVTLRLPAVPTDGLAVIRVGYAACSDAICLPPVAGHLIVLSLQRS